MHGLNETLSQLMKRFTILIRTINNLVVNIRDVSDIGHVITHSLEIAIDHIKNHHHARMTQVTEVIHRHATDIQIHLARLKRLKSFFAAREVVVDFQHEKVGLR